MAGGARLGKLGLGLYTYEADLAGGAGGAGEEAYAGYTGGQAGVGGHTGGVELASMGGAGAFSPLHRGSMQMQLTGHNAAPLAAGSQRRISIQTVGPVHAVPEHDVYTVPPARASAMDCNLPTTGHAPSRFPMPEPVRSVAPNARPALHLSLAHPLHSLGGINPLAAPGQTPSQRAERMQAIRGVDARQSFLGQSAEELEGFAYWASEVVPPMSVGVDTNPNPLTLTLTENSVTREGTAGQQRPAGGPSKGGVRRKSLSGKAGAGGRTKL